MLTLGSLVYALWTMLEQGQGKHLGTDLAMGVVKAQP